MQMGAANLFCRDKIPALFNSVPLTATASQHIEQCAIRNSILLMEGVKSFVTRQRERFMCAVKPFEVNCILLSFCACNVVRSWSYGDGGRCSPSLSVSHTLIQLCAFCVQYHCVNASPPRLSLNAAPCLPVRAITFECICSRMAESERPAVKPAASCGGPRRSDRRHPPLSCD